MVWGVFSRSLCRLSLHCWFCHVLVRVGAEHVRASLLEALREELQGTSLSWTAIVVDLPVSEPEPAIIPVPVGRERASPTSHLECLTEYDTKALCYHVT
ncbi:hypothetical protein J3F83DRAFT_345659 [Trichoderma novae-zelandiae]